MAGKFPLRSPWFMDQRKRAGLLYGAFTVKGETAQAVVWNDYFFEAASGITGSHGAYAKCRMSLGIRMGM